MQKEGTIEKSAGAPQDQEMELIGRYTRRKLAPEEVYTFSLVLCDNEVDRDNEKFSTAALEELGKLFVGKTGIFDHNPKGENQTARIYRCQMVREETRTASTGEPYCFLKADAYMVRSAKTEQLILEIDAGIKKEVSVGCAMGKALCSICGADRREAPCQHRPGELYHGVRCHTVLTQATDAYEWSFVAIPAQRQAGVVKGHKGGDFLPPQELAKVLALGEEITLSPAAAKGLAKHLEELEGLARAGEAHQKALSREVLRLGLLGEPELPRGLLEKTLAGLDPQTLEGWREHYRKKAARRLPLIQTQGESPRAKAPGEVNEQFKV